MKLSKILALLIVLTFSSIIFAQEKETEKPKETEKKEETQDNKIPECLNPSTDPNGCEVFPLRIIRGRRKPLKPRPVANVIDLELSQTTIALDESVNNDGQSDDKNKGQINVSTNTENSENDVLIYKYTVTGGKIIGQGEKVIWDLTDVKPGTYTITVAVDNGCGYCGKTVTKEIEIIECADCK